MARACLFRFFFAVCELAVGMSLKPVAMFGLAM